MLNVVFCDLDKTLISKNCSFGFGVYLFKRGILTLPKAFLLTLHYASFSIGFLSARSLHQKSFALLFRGKRKMQIVKLAEDYIETELLQHVFPRVVEVLTRLKEEGGTLHLLSTSPDFLVDICARRLGFDSSFGTEFLTSADGVFEKVGEVLDGEQKAEKAETIASREASPKKTYALSDSLHDLSLLRAVNHPIAVNPSSRLRREALKRSWQILDP
ncbi:HAD family hydrolase [Estrella lausannensis]|uniref:HAD hydrolase n=1 Tax=Estrella lausannensis TaxID=483423 RepID=A0A0H5DPV5_9BACT|nr:HAD-IB family hydrolase [Estrella lausannensis]CRX38512.1 HAD hydrolase [Estrella lausannensis]